MSAAGAETGGSGYVMCFTLGECAVHVVSQNNVVYSEGFWQPGISCTTATLEIQELGLNISVFPNPFRDHIQIDFSENLSENMLISLVNAGGMAVESTAAAKGDSAVTFDNTGLLASGIYFLQVQTSDGRIHRSLVLQKIK